MDYKDLTPIQIDALSEVSNIGAGNAATALSQLLNKKVDMTVPAIKIIPFDSVFSQINEEELVIGIIVRVLGDTPGNILFLFEKETAISIVDSLLGRSKADDGDYNLDEMGNSVLCEVGNIISGSYMNAISKFTNLVLTPSVPAVTYDMVSAILSTTFIESGQFDENVLDFETEFLQDNSNRISGHFYYIPMPGSLEKILNALGLK